MRIVHPTIAVSLDKPSNSEEDLIGKYTNEGVRCGAHIGTDSPRKSRHLGTHDRCSVKDSYTNRILEDEEVKVSFYVIFGG
jgi:hypothetical protein